MQEFLDNPAVQGGIAPFVAGLIVAAALYRLRLGGLAAVAGFCTAVYFVAGFTFTPLTATRKLILLGLAAPVIGVLADFAFKPTRIGVAVLALAAGAASVWVFWSVLQQKPAAQALLLGSGVAVYLVFVVAAALSLSEQPVRAGAAALVLGLASGIAAVLGASATYGLYGIALGAGAGAFLLVLMITGGKSRAGVTLMLTASLVAGLIAAGALLLAQLPWFALPVLALIPLAVRVPVPQGLPAWAQAVLLSVYAALVAVVAFFVSWQSGSGPSG